MSANTEAVMEQAVKNKEGHGPKYVVNIEGKDYDWDKDHISREEIAILGGWDIAQGVVEIDKDNNEITLQPGQIVQLKPGQGFGKKVRFKRGDTAIASRIAEELALLRSRFKDVEYQEAGQWVLVRNFPYPAGWTQGATMVVFQIPAPYPGTPPYGFYVPNGLRFNGQKPNNYQEPANNQPPFEGQWGFFSWTVEDGQWRATTSVVNGSNLLNVLLSFVDRLREGV